MLVRSASILLACITLTACSGEVPAASDTATVVEFPPELAAFGDGYPENGDACRQLGESETTSEWLDDSAMLIGCPADTDLASIGGTQLASIEGFSIISVPLDNASEGLDPD